MIKNILDNNKNVEINKDKIDKLKELFPSCFNNDGTFDMNNFENELKYDTKITKEGYGLNFLGKNYAKLLASLDTETILVPDEENNNKEINKDSENIYISGDNIDALKHLVKSYAGQIKCIYIDPPYNTGSDGFVYNDKFNFSIEKLVNDLDINEEEAKRIYDMTNSKSSSHSAWLTFMYPRLYLARQLLKEDGVIFISIDDNEQSNLKLLCDNIFGEENLISNLIWESKYTVSNDSQYVSNQHEHILFYAKNKSNFIIGKLPRTDLQNKDYKNRDNDIKGPWKATPLHAKSGTESSKYSLTFDNGITWSCPAGRYPRYSKETLLELYKSGELYFNNNGGVDKKTYLSEVSKKGIVPGSILKYTEVGHTHGNNEELASLIGKGIFDNPKGIKLIERLIILSNLQKYDIVLDFFSGSATTAHAVMDLNSKDNGKRKYIMVQWQEECDKNSEAYKNGYKTIDEIGQERIRRAAKKIKEETNADIDYGFKHYIIKDVNTNTLDKLEKFEPNYVLSDGSILEDFGINSVLTTWMNEDGYGLTDKYEELKLDDYVAYKCQNTIYLLNWNLTDLAIKTLIEKYELEEDFDCNRVILFGYSFATSEIQMLKDNLKQVKNIKGINVELITRY
jgi:adenine specific DNA methylase Mod